MPEEDEFEEKQLKCKCGNEYTFVWKKIKDRPENVPIMVFGLRCKCGNTVSTQA